MTLGVAAVRARVEWEAHLDGPGPYVARGRAITLDMDIDSPAGLDKLRELVGVASKACYVEALLAVPVRHRLKRGDDWLDMDEVSLEAARA